MKSMLKMYPHLQRVLRGKNKGAVSVSAKGARCLDLLRKHLSLRFNHQIHLIQYDMVMVVPAKNDCKLPPVGLYAKKREQEVFIEALFTDSPSWPENSLAVKAKVVAVFHIVGEVDTDLWEPTHLTTHYEGVEGCTGEIHKFR